jgi:hypothetical protein
MMKVGSWMSLRKLLASVLVLAFTAVGCDYIVPPIGETTPTPGLADQGWGGIVTNVTEASGALHIELSLVNNTNDWSAMDVAQSKASVADSGGTKHDCATVFVGTSVFVNNGGWYLAPGFVMKGYTAGSVSDPKTQLLYVECSGVAKGSGQKLTINYTYINGPFNYYVASHHTDATMNLDLDKVVTDTKYPIAHDSANLKIIKPGEDIPAINNLTVKLTDAKRTATGLELDWEYDNTTKYPVFVHIGIPPVIGADGILYGFYQSPHLSSPPLTPSKDKAVDTTAATVPADAKGFYVLVPVETQQNKYFIDHVIDISDK